MSAPNLISDLLAEQQTLTAVEKFARKHEHGTIPSQARYYQDLIPLSKPGPGEQYAFKVDLDACSGCKACVSACHSLNGLEEEETWRDVGLLVAAQPAKPYLQTITTACHHCADPGCLNGCPVMAYDKDKETGIVRHLDDQCIGCQYCTMKCPYEVPKYSKRLGIVRKCDMCHSRLGVGEAPACVQACPHEAIQITIVSREQIEAASLPGAEMVPGAYDSSYTKPTTQYTSSKERPGDARPADALALKLEHAHWPLIVMLVLSQLTAGAFVMLAGIATLNPPQLGSSGFFLGAIAFLALNIGLVAAVFHLGRPLGAWRFFLGLRTSWMSREILAFSVFAGAASMSVGLTGMLTPLAQSYITLPTFVTQWLPLAAAASIIGSAFLGLVAVFTSVMIYVDTRRTFWSAKLTNIQFFGTALLLGSSMAATVASWSDRDDSIVIFQAIALVTLTLLTLVRLKDDRAALANQLSTTHLSAKTIRQFLPWAPKLQMAFTGSILCYGLLALVDSGGLPQIWTTTAFLLACGSQILSRYVFFVAVRAYRMPGGI